MSLSRCKLFDLQAIYIYFVPPSVKYICWKKKIEKCFLCPSVIPFLSARIDPIGAFPPVASDVRFLRAIFYFFLKEISSKSARS